MQRAFSELEELEAVVARLGDRAQCRVVDTVVHKGREFPIHCIRLGSESPEVPVLAFFGGIHGLEKIGTEVILAYMQTVAALLDWDEEFNARLAKSRLVFMPIVNPVGVFRGTRCNGNGVDLMRNSPVESVGKTRLYSGQRLSARLPWYRGDESRMEKEAQALCRVVHDELFPAPLAIAVDLHSGFGIQDRLWFPYASNRTPYPDIAKACALKQLFDACYPHHVYKIEPMSQEYVISGDLWDYLYDDYAARHAGGKLFLPLTLEMGSWLWLRKNPTHLFQRHGLFHPLLPHRQQRIMRRHLTLFDFLYRCLLYPGAWAILAPERQQTLHRQALANWYA